jgi:single-stranded-DNA-specific exonuclease
MLNDLRDNMKNAIQALGQWPLKTLHVFHHNDSDGLSSGAILARAFGRQGYAVRRYALEKPYPEVLKRIFDQTGQIFVFADFAGRIAPMISEMNQGRNLTLILDHHAAEPATDSKVYNLDPELYGLKGDRDITASVTCFVFACLLDPANRDLAHIATIGAVGDGFFVDGRLAGENRQAALDAVDQGTVRIVEHPDGEQYFLHSAGNSIPCDEIGTYLDTLGAAGYYQGGPEMGVEVCLSGISSESEQMVAGFKKTQSRIFDEEIQRIKDGELKTTPHIQWFCVENRFSPMGVKMIGAFCGKIKQMPEIDPERYIAGFQIIPNEIPGFGQIPFNQVKISMRVSPSLADRIRNGRAMGLDVLLPAATRRLGGFSDACHSLAAATTVSIGKEAALIEEMEKILLEPKQLTSTGASDMRG